ncbi:hypothetical protein U1Q18_051092 [Sarracenia purpurea var. burkii]
MRSRDSQNGLRYSQLGRNYRIVTFSDNLYLRIDRAGVIFEILVADVQFYSMKRAEPILSFRRCAISFDVIVYYLTRGENETFPPGCSLLNEPKASEVNLVAERAEGE